MKYFLQFLFFFLWIQRTEDQMDQIFNEMGNMRIQFQDIKNQMEFVKGQLEDTKLQLENTKTELNETKIQLEESKIQLDESKIQLDESKIQLDESKIQLENTKTELNETKIQQNESKIQSDESKIQLDDSKVQGEDSMVQLEESKTKMSELSETLKSIKELGKTNSKDILANSKMMKPLLEILEYMEDPCKNCNGPVYCLDGQVVGIKRPMNGTRIAILGNTKYAGGKAQKDSLVVMHSYNTGYLYTHNTGDKYYRKIEWDSKRTTYDAEDFCQFVYKCPQRA